VFGFAVVIDYPSTDPAVYRNLFLEQSGLVFVVLVREWICTLPASANELDPAENARF